MLVKVIKKRIVVHLVARTAHVQWDRELRLIRLWMQLCAQWFMDIAVPEEHANAAK